MVQKNRGPIKMVEKKKVTKEVKEQPVRKQADFRDYLNVFEFSTKLPGSGEIIRFKPLTMGSLKKLLTFTDEGNSYQTSTQIFDEIFSETVLNEDFDPSELYLQDRFFLLIEIRKKTKGETNQYKVNCPECNSQSLRQLDFDQIEIQTRKPDIDYVVKLTDDLSVRMRFPQRKHELEIFDLWEDYKKELEPKVHDTEMSIFLEAQSIDQIITPEGPQKDITIWDKKYLIENIPQPLYMRMDKWLHENRFGPNMEIEIKCSHCDYSIKQNMMALDFFQ